MVATNRQKLFGPCIKVSLLFFWVILFVLLLKRDYLVESLDVKEAHALKRDKYVSFLGVYLNKERIGYIENSLVPIENGEYLLNQEAHLLLNIVNQTHPISLTGQAKLSSNYYLKEFSFSLEAPFYAMNIQGEVRDLTVFLRMDTGKQEISDQITLKNPPFIAMTARPYLINKQLSPGTKVKIPSFDPFTLSVQETVIQYNGKKKTLIQGMVHNLHHFSQSLNGVQVNSWLNDRGNIVKEESASGFILIAEPEFRAKDIQSSSADILTSVAVPLIGPAPQINDTSQVHYRLLLQDDIDFNLNKDRQSYNDNILVISLEKLPHEEDKTCSGQHELEKTPYIQVDHQSITSLVDSLNMRDTSPWNRVQTLANWMYESIDKKPVLGLPDAITTLANRKGDCNEHASLFTALARNAGIPTRIVAGVMLHNKAFYYHAWNEVCIGEKWLSLDTTLNQIPADLGHIKFVEGDIREQAKITALLGQLKIQALP